MADLRVSQNASQIPASVNKQQVKRIAYLSIVPVLAVLLLVAMFGLMGALPNPAWAAAGGPYFVREDGLGDVCSEGNPCSLQTAVSKAQIGEEVRVAEGTYTALSAGLPIISLTQSITLTGGYHASDWNIAPDLLAYKTVLNGQDAHRVISITAGASPNISNFYIENGSATGGFGAGIFIEKGNGQPYIHNNILNGNSASSGGGIYDGAGSIIQYNEIYSNTASTTGGAGILVDNNNGVTTTIQFNKIYLNQGQNSAGGGGLMLLTDGAQALLIANEIYDNSANYGGGIAAFPNTHLTMLSNMVYTNSVDTFGGGLYALGSVVLWNNTVADNSATQTGGGVYVSSDLETKISNNIVSFNTGGGSNGIHYDGSTASITGTNNILFGNNNNVTNEIEFTDTLDPQFVNPENSNFHIQETSPARNDGSATTPDWVNVDIDEQPRPNTKDGSIHDIGADEYYEDFAEFTLLPATTDNYVERGNIETFTHYLDNTGTVSDTYNIECSTDIYFTVTYCSPSVQILAGGNPVQITTSVEIDPNLGPNYKGTTLITATSTVSSSLSETARVRSIVAPHPGISFTPNYSRTELPGDIITLTHVITNEGDAFDSFLVTIIEDQNEWAELISTDPLIVEINSGAAKPVRVQIQVPDYAPAGLENIIKIRAASQFNPVISATVVNTITAKPTVGTRFVSPPGDNTDNNCTQSDNPCATIKWAVGQAAAGDEIRIKAGTYNEHDINLNDVFYISGGWTNFNDDGQGDEPNPEATIIDAGGVGPAFIINASHPEISVLTVENGRGGNGGAVFVKSSAEPKFENIVFRGNQAQTRGGAIFVSNNASVSIEKGVFITNTASDSGGGAVYLAGGNLFLRQSSFLTNTANSNNGGAFAMSSGAFTGQNNLFFNNEALAGDGGAVSLSGGTAKFSFSTWVANAASNEGGGVYNNGAVLTVTSSIFSENNDSAGRAIFENSGSTSLDYLDMWQNGSNIVTGTHSFTADPLFGDEKFRLGLGSPAIDVANPVNAPSVDFEDDDRPSDEGYDIGYDERTGCRTKRDDIKYGSIQAAVDVDSDDPLILVSGICRGVHTIEYDSQTISQTVHLTKSVIIQGGWNSDFSKQYEEVAQVDPEGRGRAFFISDGVSVTIEAISVTNGSAAGLGGGPNDEDAGGAFYNVDGQVTLRGVTVLTSTAELGGGFYNDVGNPLITWLYIEKDPNNEGEESYVLTEMAQGTAVSGGGIYNNTGVLNVDGARLHHNQATDGGGLFNLAGPITVANTILDSNLADNGGGLYNEAPTANYLHMTVYSNTANANGGGFYNATGDPVLYSNIFESNRATAGSAIYDADNTNSNFADYNYYYDNQGNVVVGTVTGTHSIESILPPGLTDPLTGDFHLLEDALAADQADPVSPIVTDFEDDPRPSNQGFDIGADEIVGCLVQLNDTIYGSLQTAIDDAEPGDVIKVSGNCSGVHEFSSGLNNACGDDMLTAVHITKTLTLLGGWDEAFNNQEGVSKLDAKNLGRVMYIGSGVSTTVESFAMLNGVAVNGAGICIDDNAQPTLRKNRVYSNTASTNGGGIYSLDSQTTLARGNHIYNNEATAAGGGLFLTGSSGFTAAVQNNFIYSNTANTGAGIYSASGDHTYWHNTIYGNTAANTGGGFEIPAGTPDIRGNIMMENEANGAGNSGGAIHTSVSPTTSYNDYYQNTPEDFIGETGFISVDPDFSNVISGVFTITIDSPVVDIDIPDMPLTEDYEEDIRPSHQGYDLGADEVGGCFATIAGQTDIVYGSVQKAVDVATAGDTIFVDGICQNVNSRIVNTDSISQTLLIDKDLTIDGSWDYKDDTSTVTTTLQANGKGRVVYVTSGATVSITNIIIRDGDAAQAGDISDVGGGIFNAGTLTILKAWIQENNAEGGAGLYNNGTLTIDESYVITNTATQDGGGIQNVISATIQNSTIRGNKAVAGDGGGIHQDAGNLTVDKNRINANIAGGNGAGISLYSGSAIKISNNFIYNNNANTGGGLYNTNTSANIWHNTFYKNTAQSGNGGGVANAGGSPSINSNIIDQNTGSGFYASGGTISADFNNVVGHFDDYVPDTLQGPNDISANPDYVKPSEGNLHLNQGSAGEDVGDANLPVNDDIDGDLRPTNGGPDIGADEINSCLVRVGGNDDAIFGVLQDAIDFAYTEGETNIEIARGECRGVKYNDTSETYQVAYITSTLHFTGSLQRNDFSDPNDYYNPEVSKLTTMINAADEGHVIYIADGAAPSFYQIAFVDGNAVNGGSTNGGAIYKAGSGEASFRLNYFCDSTAENGGAIYIEPNASLDITGVRVGNCIVKQITENEDGTVAEQIKVSFDGNNAIFNGGGFYIDGHMSMRNADLFGNLADINGGGGYISSTASLLNDPELINATFYINVAQTGTGGALHNEAANVKLYHNTIRDNFAQGNGGGVYNKGNALELNSSIVYANTSLSGDGGGFYDDAATNATLKYNNFYGNSPNAHPGSVNSPSIDGEPGIFGIRDLSVHSVNIDKADPDLLLLPNPIDYDYFLDDRPDGDRYLDYIAPAGIFSDVGADEYYKDFGCKIVNDGENRTATPGTPLTYTLLITNTGNIYYPDTEYPYTESNGYTDTLTVTISSVTQPGWSSLEGGNEQSILLGWDDPFYGEGATRVLTVTVPEGTPAGTTEETTVLCRSQSLSPESDAWDSVIIKTSVGETGGVRVDPPYEDSAIPGEVRVYTYTVTNLQNQEATYRLTSLSGLQHANAVLLDSDTMLPVPAITVTLQPTGTQGGGYTTTAYMQVTILDTAIAGDYANPGLNATDTSSGIYDSTSNRTLILSAPATRYVAGDSGTNTTNCADPLQPCATIQYAIEQAHDKDGNIDEIKVAAFTYTDHTARTVGTDTVDQVLFINKSVSISGGYTTTEQVPFTTQEPISNAVKLNGMNARRVIYVTDGVTPTLSSLFIENGNAAPFNTGSGTFGSGIYNAGANLTIYSTWIQNNIGQYGAGVYHEDGLLTMYSNILSGNANPGGTTTHGEGGGLYLANGVGLIENNTFADNLVNDNTTPSFIGSASAAPTGFGGGIFLDEPTIATVINNIFSENFAASGTAIYISSTATLTNSYNLYVPEDIGNSNTIANGSYGIGRVLTDTAGFVSFTDYHIRADSPAKDVGTDSVSISQTVDIDLEERIMGVRIDIGADERIQRPGFVFEPAVLSTTIDSGDVFTYYHWITNTGDFVDSYDLAMVNQVIPAGDATWDYYLEPTSTGNIDPLASVQVTLVITGGQPGYMDVTTITATSASLLSASVQDTTMITQTPGIEIAQSESDYGLPGELITYTHTVTNTGNGLDEVTLTATAVPTDWVYSLTPSQPFYLGSGVSAPVTVTVLIPTDAISSSMHQVIVTATVSDPDAFDVLTDTTTVGLVSGLTLTPDYTRTVADGTSTIYTHTLTSGSNITDTVMLTVTGDLPSWGVSVYPESVVLDPYQSEIVSVTVDVPLNTGGLTHLTHVTATSTVPGLVATATNTTTVPVNAQIMFTPNLTEVVYAGNMAYYTHTLTNLGNLTDTFNIISNSVQGWLFDITDGPLTVAPGASVQVTAVISVPLGTPPETIDILEITAISQADTDVTATVTDTTQVIRFVALTFMPDHEEPGDAGTTQVYTHTLTNDGDWEETFNLTYSGVPPWAVTLEPPTSILLGAGETAVITASIAIPSGASGYTNTTTITATSAYNPSIAASVVNTTTVSGEQAQLGVLLEPDRFAVGNLNETLTYYHTVTNTGDVADDISLFVASSVWAATVEPEEIIGLLPGASAPVTVTVTIPAAAAAGEEDMAVITAVSQSDPAYSSSVTDTTRVVQTHGLLFFPDNAQTTDAGTTIYYTHTLQNDGNAPDTFEITPNSQWTTAVNTPVTLDIDESTTIHITLTVPAGTEGQTDVMQVTATSIFSPVHTVMVTNTTTVNEGIPPVTGVDIEPDHQEYAVGGDVLTYIHTVTNNGEDTDTFDVTVVSSLRWIPLVSPASLTLASSETGLVTVTVTVPNNVNTGARDETTVTVTSQTDATTTDSAVDTTIIPGIFLPIIMKAETVVNPTPTPPPGPTDTPQPTATPGCIGNTGKDLIVENMWVEPGSPTAGTPAVVFVTIKNQGTVNIAPDNNFYVDFYVDHAPARYLIGNIEWGVQGEWMQAGQSYTLRGNYTFSGGAHQLWAQVDTDNTVDECPHEDNNEFGPVAITVSGTSSTIKQSEQLPPNDAPRHTPTPEGSASLLDDNLQPVLTERPLSTPTPTLTVTPPPS